MLVGENADTVKMSIVKSALRNMSDIVLKMKMKMKTIN